MVVKATHKAFTPAYRIAQRDELSLGQYRVELLKQRANVYEVGARKVARQVFRCVQRTLQSMEADNSLTVADKLERRKVVLCAVNLKSIARGYQCKTELLDYAVECVQQMAMNFVRNGGRL